MIRSLFLRLVNKACSRRVTWVLFTYGIFIIRSVPFLFGIGPYYKAGHMLLKSNQFGAVFRVPGQSQNQSSAGIAQDQYALIAALPGDRRPVLLGDRIGGLYNILADLPGPDHRPSS